MIDERNPEDEIEDGEELEGGEEDEGEDEEEATDPEPAPAKPNPVIRAIKAVAKDPTEDTDLLSAEGLASDDISGIVDMDEADEEYLFGTEHSLIDAGADHSGITQPDDATMDYLTNPNYVPKRRGVKYIVAPKTVEQAQRAKRQRDEATDEFLFGTKGIL